MKKSSLCIIHDLIKKKNKCYYYHFVSTVHVDAAFIYIFGHWRQQAVNTKLKIIHIKKKEKV